MTPHCSLLHRDRLSLLFCSVTDGLFPSPHPLPHNVHQYLSAFVPNGIEWVPVRATELHQLIQSLDLAASSSSFFMDADVKSLFVQLQAHGIDW